jgi:hypothetical protein
MCRACYAVVVGPEAEQQRLRRAAGLDVQVVAMTASFTDALTMDPAPDVLIVHAGSPLQPPGEPAGPAIVWVGSDAPGWVDHAAPDDEALGDALPGAIVKALVARRSR